ncbi:MAG: type II toxin-antitoxin system RelE/ParE family toxin [Hyphomicrobiales bacterium]
MRVRFTPQAKSDLDNIESYCGTLDPALFPRVLGDIVEALEVIMQFPGSGHIQLNAPVRKSVTLRYGYLIYYRHDPGADAIDVIKIAHGRQQRPFEDR